MGRLETAQQPMLATRVYGPRFSPDLVLPKLTPFAEHASAYGVPLVVLHPGSPSKKEVHAFAQTSGAHVIYSEPSRIPERYNPAYMINAGIRESFRRGHQYMGIISNDLAHHIPQLVPEMISRLDRDPELATVGVAIDSVHDMDLLARVQHEGMGIVTPNNYATVWPNNAFSLHRVSSNINGFTPRDFEFEELYEDVLGHTQIGGKRVELQLNEEIARWLLSARKGYPLKHLLLAGQHALQRDPEKPDSASPYKKQRRQATADSYRRQPQYKIPDEELYKHLQIFYQIDFGLAV